MALPPIRSSEARAGCPCGRPFPSRVYFARALAAPPIAFEPGDTFFVACRCGRAFPWSADGQQAPPLGSVHLYEPPPVQAEPEAKRKFRCDSDAALFLDAVAEVALAYGMALKPALDGRGWVLVDCCTPDARACRDGGG